MGKTYRANTHAEFLNQAFGTHYKGFGKATHTRPNGEVVWLVEFTGKASKNGFCNALCNNGEIITEEYYGNDSLTRARFVETARGIRIAVNVNKSTSPRIYEILGRYQYACGDDASCAEKHHVWKRIKD